MNQYNLKSVDILPLPQDFSNTFSKDVEHLLAIDLRLFFSQFPLSIPIKKR